MAATFGLSLAASVREPIGRIADLVAKAEQLGFDIAYILDSQLPFKDVYVTMTVCALQTHVIRLAPGVTNPITRDISVTASAISAIQEISHGRAILGIGNGGTAVEGIGIKGSNLAATRESVLKLRALLDGNEVTHNDVRVHMQPARPYVPIYLSGSRPKMLKLAGQVADGVVLMGSSHPRLLQEQLDQVFAGLGESGRRRDQFTVDLWQTISVQDLKEKAIEDVKAWVASQVEFWFSRIDELPPELERVIDREVIERISREYEVNKHLSLQAEHRKLVNEGLADLMTIAGNETHCVQKLRQLSQLDVDNITLSLLSGGRESRLTRLGEVISAV
jgi:5,10-methylenetetrahydromethanopterin reductase